MDLLGKILDEQFPPENKWSETESYAELLRELLHFSINTPKKLRDLLVNHTEFVKEDESNQVRRCRQEIGSGRQPTGNSADRTNQGVYYTHTGLARIALRNEVGEKWNEYKNSVAQKARESKET